MGQAATSTKAMSDTLEYEKTHKSSPQTKAWADKLKADGKKRYRGVGIKSGTGASGRTAKFTGKRKAKRYTK